MGLLQRVKSAFGGGRFAGAQEGATRGSFVGYGEFGNSYGIEPFGDGWQRHLEVDRNTAQHVPGVYACVMAIARAVSQCYPKHVRVSDGVHEEIKTTAAYRVLRNPNKYQASPDFLLNLIAKTLFDGEGFALATRNDRFEINALHLLPRGSCVPMITEDQDIMYAVGAAPLVSEKEMLVPARDILHLRFHTPRHPLIGESPITAAAMAIGINVALTKNQAAFFNQMNRPSGILSTTEKLTREQLASMRIAFEEQSKRWAAGGMPILAGGLTFQPLSISSQDAQLVEVQRMTLQDICRVFGVPPPLVADLASATLNNSESLIQHFLSMSLGSYLEHLERALDRLFGLGNNEFIELDTAALLRTDFAGRVNALTKAVQGGLMTPDEARAVEGLSPVKGGDTAYLQRQMVPIDKIGDLLESTQAAQNAQAAQPAPSDTPTPSDSASPGDSSKSIDCDITRALIAQMLAGKKAITT
jgi:HK97 family phage portal protein